jgi:hypothetical protein
MRRKISSASASGRLSSESYSFRSCAFSWLSSSFLRFKAFDRVVLASTSYTQSSYRLAHGWQVGLTPSHWYQLSMKPSGLCKVPLTFMRSRLQHAHATWTTLRLGLVTFASDTRWDVVADSDLLLPRPVSLQEAASVEAWLPSMFMSCAGPKTQGMPKRCIPTADKWLRLAMLRLKIAKDGVTSER